MTTKAIADSKVPEQGAQQKDGRGQGVNGQGVQRAELRAALAETRAEREAYERQLAEMRAEDAENRAEYEARARRQAEAENRRLRAALEALRRRLGGR